MKLALKIDVDTFRGTREGVPRLVEALQRHGAGATFLFSLGPDHTGVYGTLLPGPDIGRRCAEVLRKVRDAGFEVGVHAWNRVKWQNGVAKADEEWTTWQMSLASQRFRDVFGAEPAVHGAAGWQMNVHAYRRTQSLGFQYASDTRGTHPFIPVVRAEIVACPQFPTTLPTLDEMIGLHGVTEGTVAEAVLARTSEDRRDHVFTLRAELEGMKLLPAFEALLEGWKTQGYEVVPMQALVEATALPTLPLHSVIEAPVPGRSGALASQGPVFLSA